MRLALLCVLSLLVSCQTFEQEYNVPDNANPKYKIKVHGWTLFSNAKAQNYPVTRGQLYAMGAINGTPKRTEEEVVAYTFFTNVVQTQQLMEAAGNLATVLQSVKKKTGRSPDEQFSTEVTRADMLKQNASNKILTDKILKAKTLSELKAIKP